MSLLGKILAILNVMAALAFTFLALADYSKRQSWAYSVFRHDLAIDGLPLDKDELGLDGRPRVDDLGKETQEDVFRQVGGQPVTTQVEEVARLRSVMQSKLDQPDLQVADPLNPKAPLKLSTPAQRYAWAMLPLTRTANKREELLQRMRQPQGPEVPPDQFFAAFDDALKKNDPDDRRQRIADLLLALTDLQTGDGAATGTTTASVDTPAYKRMLTVVGLQAAVAATNRRTTQLETLAKETSDAIRQDRLNFVSAHQFLLNRIRETSEQVQIEDDFLQALSNRATAQEQLKKKREDEVGIIKGQLKTARKRTQDMLDQQARMQQIVFDAQLKLRDANKENQELLREIEKLENRR
jgi:hypothetical protein